jgi:hypothetical protein
MTDRLTFLPWLRRGLVSGLSTRDRGQATFERSPAIEVYVDVDSQRADSTVRLRPADHVTGLDATQIARRYPAPDSRNVETGYWPLVEFAAPDRPWAMTPLIPGGPNSRLRPWIVLVCLPVDQVDFAPAGGTASATITVDAALLPDLADAALWAHVQSDVDAASTPAAADGSGVLSRLIAPVDLTPSTTYRAAVVPSFVAVDDATFEMAWTATPGPVTLRVFDTWTFTTGVASTFEEVVGLLGPVDPALDLDLGARAVDVTDLGAIDPWPDEEHVEVDYAGALIDLDVDPAELGELHDAFLTELVPLLEAGDFRVVLGTTDEEPVVTPPLYGAYAARDHTVPSSGWRRFVNITVRHRMAAGLGARIVRRHQERFMAQAWAQAGQVRETRRALNASRLQAEIGRTLARRARRLDDGQHVGVLRAQYTTVRDPIGVAARGALGWSGIPNGLFDPVTARTLRPGSTAGRAAARRVQGRASHEGDDARPTADTMTARLNRRLGDPDARSRIRFGLVDAPRGAVMLGHRDVDPADVVAGIVDPWTGSAASRFDEEHPDVVDLVVVAATGRGRIDPMAATRARVDARIGGLADHLAASGFPADEIPTRIAIGPRIDESLVWSLIEESPELLMPGAGSFPDNAVRVVAANPTFVASLMAGANHEMNRELLWREYPADMGSTTFHRFWDRPDQYADVGDLADWEDASLTAVATDPAVVGGEGESVVVLAKGDVFRLYPNLTILLRDPSGALAPPVFGGTLPPATRFFAFDVESVDEVLRPGWFVRFQEQPTEPRFGTDEDVTLDMDNAATYAATAYQKPFALEFPVTDIVGEDVS